jgi:cytochrome c-type biogenesis protein CcmH
MVFYAIAAAMIAVALAALLLPLVLQGRRTGRSRGVFVLVLAIALVLPLAAGWLYLEIGTPVAINGVAPQAIPLTMQQAVSQLRAHLTEKPDDLQAWTLLAQTSTLMHNTADARDAFDHILKLAPNNADAMVGWAEADAMLKSDHVIGDRAVALLKHAVQLQPDSQRGLWLLGTSEFQQGNYSGAAATWRLLEPQLEPGSEVAKAVAEQVSQADARAGGAPAEAASTHAVAATTQQAALQVQVSLASDLKAKLAPGDTLFIYARPVSGPPMPLAVARLEASQLPAEVTLTDAMAMTPARTLSSVAQVFVGARISHGGQPIAQPGDLEGSAGIIDVTRKTPVEILINKVH